MDGMQKRCTMYAHSAIGSHNFVVMVPASYCLLLASSRDKTSTCRHTSLQRTCSAQAVPRPEENI